MPFLHGYRALFYREQRHPAGAESVAGSLQRTGKTVWVLRGALQGAEVHHSLVEGRCLRLREQLLGQGGEFLLGLRGSHGRSDAEMPGQHPVHIAVHYRCRQAEANGADGSGGVIPDTFEAADALHSVREAPHGHYLFGGRVQVTGTGIIAQTFPKAQDFIFRGLGQIFNGREALHKALPVSRSLRNPGLLKDDFTEPDGIRIHRTAPGKVPSVGGIPVQDGAGKSVHQRKLCSFS